MIYDDKEFSILITGAGGFIGGHLAKQLHEMGHKVTGVDLVKPVFFSEIDICSKFILLDLWDYRQVTDLFYTKFDHVYHFAANMGGMGFISKNQSSIFNNNTRIDSNVLQGASKAGVSKFIYASSGCVYPAHLQASENVTPLKEDDAFPADPTDGSYAWAKIIGELGCQFCGKDYPNIMYHIIRLHNVYGPHGTWKGGREKAPAALCRKIALAKLFIKDSIEIWGDGEQIRSFLYIDDCITGIFKIVNSCFQDPINLGSDRPVTINELVDIISQISGMQITKNYVEGPQGVRGRNSDNTLLRNLTGWEPSISLGVGLEVLYEWIENEAYKWHYYNLATR